MSAPAKPEETSESVAEEKLEPGAIVDERYEILDFLGEGGFARVYRARHVHIDRPVAIKVLDVSKVPRASGFEARFVREAQTAARIDHPNVVTIHDFGFSGDSRRPYLAMELLEGHDLEAELAENGRLETARAVTLFLGALDALAEAHTEGIVHKDLKPSNLFITHPGESRENMLVLDFGVASVGASAQQRLTATGQILGTPQYLSPEYIQDQIALPAFDVYQMGLILAEMLTGAAIIDAENPFQILMAHCQGNYELPVRLLDSPLGPVLEQALAIDHDARYQNAGEFRDALAELDVDDLPSLTDEDLASCTRIEQSGISNAITIATNAPEIPAPGEVSSMDSGPVSARDPSVRQSINSLAALSPEAQPVLKRTWPWLVGAVVVVLLGSWIGLRAFSDTNDESAGAAATDSEAGTASTDENEPSEAATGASPDPDEGGSGEALADDERGTTEATAESDRVEVALASEPSGASVWLGSSKLGTTPTTIELDRGDAPVELRLSADGFEDTMHSVVPTKHRALTVELQPRESEEADDERDGETDSGSRRERRDPDREPEKDEPETEDDERDDETEDDSDRDSRGSERPTLIAP